LDGAKVGELVRGGFALDQMLVAADQAGSRRDRRGAEAAEGHRPAASAAPRILTRRHEDSALRGNRRCPLRVFVWNVPWLRRV